MNPQFRSGQADPAVTPIETVRKEAAGWVCFDLVESMAGQWNLEADFDTEDRFIWEEEDWMHVLSARCIEASQPPSNSGDDCTDSDGDTVSKRPRLTEPYMHADDVTREAGGEVAAANEQQDEMSKSSCGSPTTRVDASFSDVDKEHPSMEQAALDEELCAAVNTGDVRAFHDVLGRGANVDALTADGRPLLHLAVLNESQEITRLMLRSGVDVEAADSENDKALHVAAERGSKHAVQLLIIFGASVNASDRRGYAPVVNAVMGGKVENAAVLLDAGADQAMCLQLMVKYRSDQDLMYLLMRAQLPIDLELENDEGLTPLMQAATWGDGMEGKEKITVLLDAGAKVGQVSAVCNHTALHLACYHGHAGNAYHLLARGAPVWVRDHRGLLPIDVARLNNGRGWICERYIIAVSEATYTGALEGVDLYADNTRNMWETPFELRRIFYPKETTLAIATWAAEATADAVACYTFLGDKGSPASAFGIMFWGQERKCARRLREVGSGNFKNRYVGCVAAYLVHPRNTRMNIADALTSEYWF